MKNFCFLLHHLSCDFFFWLFQIFLFHAIQKHQNTINQLEELKAKDREISELKKNQQQQKNRRTTATKSTKELIETNKENQVCLGPSFFSSAWFLIHGVHFMWIRFGCMKNRKKFKQQQKSFSFHSLLVSFRICYVREKFSASLFANVELQQAKTQNCCIKTKKFSMQTPFVCIMFSMFDFLIRSLFVMRCCGIKHVKWENEQHFPLIWASWFSFCSAQSRLSAA